MKKTNTYLDTERRLIENRHKIKSLRDEIKVLKKFINKKEEVENKKKEIKSLSETNRDLNCKLSYYKKSNYGGEFYSNGKMFEMFGKRRKDLTPEELRLYNKVKKTEWREKNKKN